MDESNISIHENFCSAALVQDFAVRPFFKNPLVWLFLSATVKVIMNKLLSWIELPWKENLTNTVCKIRNCWTPVPTLLGLISSVRHHLPPWRSNQRPHNAHPKLCHWATGSHRTQAMLEFPGFSGHSNSIYNIILSFCCSS